MKYIPSHISSLKYIRIFIIRRAFFNQGVAGQFAKSPRPFQPMFRQGLRIRVHKRGGHDFFFRHGAYPLPIRLSSNELSVQAHVCLTCAHILSFPDNHLRPADRAGPSPRAPRAGIHGWAGFAGRPVRTRRSPGRRPRARCWKRATCCT